MRLASNDRWWGQATAEQISDVWAVTAAWAGNGDPYAAVTLERMRDELRRRHDIQLPAAPAQADISAAFADAGDDQAAELARAATAARGRSRTDPLQAPSRDDAASRPGAYLDRWNQQAPAVERLVRGCAKAAVSEAGFVRGLRAAGLVPQLRHGPDGAVNGYAVGRDQQRGDPLWFGAGRLAHDLSLDYLRQHPQWDSSAAARAAALAEWEGGPERPGRPAATTYDFVVTDEVTDSYGDGDLYSYRTDLERGTLTVPAGGTLEDVAARHLAGQAARTRRSTDRVEISVYPAGLGAQARNVSVERGGYGNHRTEWQEPPPVYRISAERAAAAAPEAAAAATAAEGLPRTPRARLAAGRSSHAPRRAPRRARTHDPERSR
jgi:hypothetical protein